MAWKVEVPRDVLRVHGPDAVSFLQGQLSQDVAAVPSGFSFLLEPQGKVVALLRVTRGLDDSVLLDVDAGWGDVVLQRLQRFKLRTKADIDVLDGWRCVAVRGYGADVVDVVGTRTVAETAEGIDVLGADANADADDGDPVAYEELRIRAGMPRMGREIDGTTIPASTGMVDRAVSFAKGCYTGQELVARIDSRGGSTPTKIVGVLGAVGVGATLTVAGREIGRVTSAANDVGLAIVRREVSPPVAADADGVGVVLAAVPLT